MDYLQVLSIYIVFTDWDEVIIIMNYVKQHFGIWISESEPWHILHWKAAKLVSSQPGTLIAEIIGSAKDQQTVSESTYPKQIMDSDLTFLSLLFSPTFCRS